MYRLFYLFLLSTFLFMACSEDNDNGTGSDGMTSVEFSFNGLETLQNGFHYEGWAILNGAPVTTGKFNVDATGNLVDLNGNSISNEFSTPDKDDLSNAAAFVITIEPSGDSDAIPAATKILGGDLSGTTAALSVAHGATLGDDFTSASGTFILATPTTSDMSDENSGIWFLDPTGNAMTAGLSLPSLPSGWAYEGWAVINGTPITTGRFTDVAAADLAAPYSGSDASGPPFPGEDFVTSAPSGLSFPTDLAGMTAVISVEPEPDDTPAPFTLKPLVEMISVSATDHTPYSMTNNAAAFPTAIATIK